MYGIMYEPRDDPSKGQNLAKYLYYISPSKSYEFFNTVELYEADKIVFKSLNVHLNLNLINSKRLAKDGKESERSEMRLYGKVITQ
jgi:hypothetical protein